MVETAGVAWWTSRPPAPTRGQQFMTHYVGGQGGVIGFTKSLALELGPKGITVKRSDPASSTRRCCAARRARASSARPTLIGDETWATLAAEFDERQLMDVVFTVGAYDVLAMALRTFAVPLGRRPAAAMSVPYAVEVPDRIPKERYYDPDFYASRPSSSGPGCGRWPAGSRRSPASVTSSSTRSSTSPSWWCARRRPRWRPTRTRAATAASRSSRAAARSRRLHLPLPRLVLRPRRQEHLRL